MYLTVDQGITQTSWRFTTGATGMGYTAPGPTIPAYAVGTAPPSVQNLIDGPPIIDPTSGLPYTALRITLEGLGALNSALVRFIAGAPYGGGQVERVMMVTAATPVALMAGKYTSVRLELCVLTPNATLAWEWFNDTSGVVGGTNLYTPFYDVGKGGIVQCPAGAERLFFNEPVVINWGVALLNGGGGPGGVNTWDKAGSAPLSTPSAEGVPVQAPQFTLTNALPAATVCIQWQMTNL
jgi:hypothetical protein